MSALKIRCNPELERLDAIPVHDWLIRWTDATARAPPEEREFLLFGRPQGCRGDEHICLKIACFWHNKVQTTNEKVWILKNPLQAYEKVVNSVAAEQGITVDWSDPCGFDCSPSNPFLFFGPIDM